MTHSPEFTFRLAQESDRTPFFNLARLAFTPLRSPIEFEQEMGDRSVNLPGRNGWVVENSNGAIVGRYRHLELALFFQGVRFPMAGVAGVSVALESRGQRVARWMLEQALRDFRAQQIPLSMLYPFQHGFYRSLGWAWAGQSYQYRVSTRHLPLYPERSQIVSVHPSQQENVLETVYTKTAPSQNGWLQRESWHWEPYLEPHGGQEIYGYVEAGEWLGYVVIRFTYLDAAKSNLVVVVQEWVALTASAYRGIIGFLASLRDQFSTVVWNTYPHDPFPHLLKEQRRDPALPTLPFRFGFVHPFAETGTGYMWRLVDVAKALELRPINAGEPFAVQFQVADPVFGAERFAVECEQGKMHCMTRSPATTIKLSIDHLTALFSGSRTATELHWTGEIEIAGDQTVLKRLDAAWQATPPFCWDFF